MSKEVMKLALEALESTEYPHDHYDALVALREALAAPVPQGSIQHLKTMMEESAWEGRIELSDALANIDEFYTTPPAAPVSWIDELQVAEALRQYGLTLVKTSPGYAVLKIGQIDAQFITKGQE